MYKRCPQSIRAANIDVKNAFVILQHLWTNEFGAAYRFVCACLSASDLKDERENERVAHNKESDDRARKPEAPMTKAAIPRNARVGEKEVNNYWR